MTSPCVSWQDRETQEQAYNAHQFFPLPPSLSAQKCDKARSGVKEEWRKAHGVESCGVGELAERERERNLQGCKQLTIEIKADRSL